MQRGCRGRSRLHAQAAEMPAPPKHLSFSAQTPSKGPLIPCTWWPSRLTACALSSLETAVPGKGCAPFSVGSDEMLWLYSMTAKAPFSESCAALKQGTASATHRGRANTRLPDTPWTGHCCALQWCGHTPLKSKCLPWSLQVTRITRRDSERRRQDAELAAGGQMGVFGDNARMSPQRYECVSRWRDWEMR